MKKHFHKILFIITIAIMTLIMTQTLTDFIKLKPLKGAMVKAEMPDFNFKNYVDGSFQSGIEAYGKDNFGFHEWLIRLYNQYLWSCFKMINNNNILLGKDRWLYEINYVKDHYESMMYDYASDSIEMKKRFETEALRLWKVQELLKEHDIYIFVSMIPGKDVIYPEFLPQNTMFHNPEGVHAYDFYKKRFDELGVNCIDFVENFKNIKNSVYYQLFPKTGTHWSNIAAVHVTDTIINYMEAISGKNLVNIEIGEPYESSAREPDDDLEQLLNLAFKIKSKPYLYANVKSADDPTATKPYITVIGDSFYRNIMLSVPLNDIFEKAPYWYYNSTIYCDDLHHSTSEIDFNQELMRTDFIMLNYCTVQIYDLGNKFISKALINLCYDKSTVDSVTEKVINDIKSNEQWYQNIVEKAQNLNISVDEALFNDANYMINLYPENYFEELKGEELPISRNQDLFNIRNNIINASQNELQDMINRIYSDHDWLESVRNKAEKNGVTLQEQVELDAQWVLSNKQ